MFKNIHFLNYKLLAVELSKHQIDDKLAFKYLIWTIILFGGSTNFPVKIVVQNPNSSLFEFIFPIITYIVLTVINIYGIWYLFQKNKTGDGKEFFKRIICLGFPVSLFLMLLFFAPIFIILSWASSLTHLIVIVFEFVIEIVMTIYFYWLMNKCFSFISMATVELKQKEITSQPRRQPGPAAF